MGRRSAAAAHRVPGEVTRGSTVELTSRVACALPCARERWEWLKRGLQRPTSVCPPAFSSRVERWRRGWPTARTSSSGWTRTKRADRRGGRSRPPGAGRSAHLQHDYRLPGAAGVPARWPGARWAIEGAAGLGQPPADRLIGEGLDVVDVPAKLSARVRSQSWSRTQDRHRRCGLHRHRRPHHSHASPGLPRPVGAGAAPAQRPARRPGRRPHPDRQPAARRNHPPRARRCTDSADCPESAALLRTVRPRELVAKTQRPLAADLLTDLRRLDGQLKTLDKQLAARRERQRQHPDRLSTASGPSWPSASSAASRTSPASTGKRTSLPTAGPRPSTSPPAIRSATGSPARATACSTTPCTSWRSPKPADTTRAAP